MSDFGPLGGVKITGFISPTTTGDTYAVIDPLYGIDGLRSVPNKIERNAIPELRRRHGMIVFTQDSSEFWLLNPSPWVYDDSDWSLTSLSGNFGNVTNQFTSVVSVTANTANNFSGTSDPTITGYSSSVVYLTTFDSPNTNTGTTLNIEGLGDLPLTKVGVSGLTEIEAYDVLTGVTYNIVYNGDSLQVLLSEPVNDPSTYTTYLGPIPINIGGVTVNTTYDQASMQEVFDDLFYPNLKPIFTSFYIQEFGAANNQNREVGNDISSGSYTFRWSTSNSGYVKPNSIKIYDDTWNIISTPTSGITNDGIESITLPTITNSGPNDYIWRVSGRRTTNANIPTRYYRLFWRFRRYWGTSSDATPTISTVTGLTSSDLNGHVFTRIPNSVGVFDTNFAPGEYKYICYPTTAGIPNLFKDNLTLLNMAMADPNDGFTTATPNGNWYYTTVTNVPNQFGITTNYRCFRSKYQLGGAVDIRVT